MSIRISAAVMCHPSRLDAAGRLAGRLAPLTSVVTPDPDPDGAPTSLRAAVRAWAAADASGGATHHLVVQDDVVPVPGFAAELLRAVRQRPDAVLAFYANWNSWNGAAVRTAALRGCAWTAALADEYVPTLALVMPRRHALAFAAHARPRTAEGTPDDEVVAGFVRERGLDVLIRTRNLVEHDEGMPSLTGNGYHGPRRSVLPDTAELRADGSLRDEVSPVPAVLPHLFLGRTRVIARDPRGLRPGWRHLAAARPAAAGPAGAWDAYLSGGEAYAAGVVLGSQLPDVPGPVPAPTVSAALRTAVHSALGPALLTRWDEAWTEVLAERVRHGVLAGARLRATGGALPWAARDWEARPEASAIWAELPDPAWAEAVA